MSLQPITSQGAQLTHLSEGNIVRTFGFLDIKSLGVVASVCELFARLQGDDSMWSSLFPQAPSCLLNYPTMKERVRNSQILWGTPEEYYKQCSIDFFNKTITQVHRMGNVISICPFAFEHPDIPNGSFVAYSFDTVQIPSAVIKSKDGIVSNIILLFEPDQSQNAFKLELQEHQGKHSQFHEFKLILKYNNHIVYENIKNVANCLKGLPYSNDPQPCYY